MAVRRTVGQVPCEPARMSLDDHVAMLALVFILALLVPLAIGLHAASMTKLADSPNVAATST